MSQTTTAQAEATGEAPAGEAPAGETGHTTEGTVDHGAKVFPPLDATTFPSQIFWLVVFFALLYLLMSKVALPRVERILHTRSQKIEGDLARAQALKEETESAIKAYEKALTDARAKATGIGQDARGKLMAEVEAERSNLEAALSKKLAEAEALIGKSRDKAMAEVDGMAADTAAEIVAALTGAKVTKTDAAKAVAEAKG
ncbi:MAG: F0F1 ATP synthase subunit B [Hyphomicrobiales bacterium]|jgi:F-type H+-transporting ATPase subunit b